MFENVRKASVDEMLSRKEPTGIRKDFLDRVYPILLAEPNVWHAIVENLNDYEKVRSNLDNEFSRKYKLKIKTRQTNKELRLGNIYVMFCG